MARIDQLPSRGGVSGLRLSLIALFLISVAGTLAYLAQMPLKQVYWGVSARLRPFISEHDLVKAGKLPGGDGEAAVLFGCGR
jgi:hypothetical protein